MNYETQLCSMVFKVLQRKQQSQPGTPGRTPSLLDKCTGMGSLHALHNTWGQQLYIPSEGMKQWLSVLLKDTSVTAGGFEPTLCWSHQSLNSVLWITRPWHRLLLLTAQPLYLKTRNFICLFCCCFFPASWAHWFPCYGEGFRRWWRQGHPESRK